MAGVVLPRRNVLPDAPTERRRERLFKGGERGAGPEADACLGDCAKRLGDMGYKEAKRHYLRAVDKGMQNAALLNNLGVVASYSPQPAGRQFDEAEQYFEAAIR